MRLFPPGPSVGCAAPIRGAAAQPTGGIRRSCGRTTRTTRTTDNGHAAFAGRPASPLRTASGRRPRACGYPSRPPQRECAPGRAASDKDRTDDASGAILKPRVGPVGLLSTTTNKEIIP